MRALKPALKRARVCGPRLISISAGLAACGQGFADQLQVDLGLAAAGDPGQRETWKPPWLAQAASRRRAARDQRQLLGQPTAFSRGGVLMAPHLQFDQARTSPGRSRASLFISRLVSSNSPTPLRMLLENRQASALARRPGQARIVEAGCAVACRSAAGAHRPFAWRNRLGSAQDRVSPRLCW